MELIERMEALGASVERLNRRIAILNARRSDPASDPALEAVIEEHIRVRNDSLREIRGLKQQYNQRMLSRMVRGGIRDDETLAWWMNRY